MAIGRKKEFELFNKILRDGTSHFIAVYGRRRVGKTFLIRQAFSGRFTFQHAGLYDGDLKAQLYAFSSSLSECGYVSKHKPESWLEAFSGLKEIIKNSTEKKKVIFIDELSWMDTPKSDLMMALENFWNGFASARNDVILIVCASATSWMLSKVVHNKGGLYNRLTEQINLKSFSLKECEDYVRENNLVFNRLQVLQYYMIFGGVPYYWTFLQKGKSLAQNIDDILFADDAPLKDEFKYLYASIFKHPEDYVRIIEVLALHKSGITRDEIIEKTGLANSGALTSKLEELESCGFIRKYNAFGMKAKGAIFQLIDNFTLFHFQFLTKNQGDEHFWSNQINTPAVNTWLGLAFERVCLEHIPQIKQKLGISGVITEMNCWHCKSDSEKGLFGSQIDLLIVRKDQVINLCEMKYSASEYTIDKKDDESLRHKISDFVKSTGTKYAFYPTLFTTYGLVQNSYSDNIQAVIVAEDLF